MLKWTNAFGKSDKQIVILNIFQGGSQTIHQFQRVLAHEFKVLKRISIDSIPTLSSI